MINRWYGRAVSVSLIALGCALAAQANNSTYIFESANSGAEAVLTMGPGTITVTLYDLFVNPLDVADNLSAFSFTTSVTPTSAPTIATSTADSINIAGNGTYTDAGNVAPGWAINTNISAVTKLDDLSAGGAGPAHTLVGAPNGSGVYSNANGSLTNGNMHDPFLKQTATWTLDEAGITTATTISNVIFQFGTADGSGLSSGGQVFTPEPASAGLLVLGGISLLLMGRKSLFRSR